ncbi:MULTISPECIES: hypothetical protein [unclassified Bradyrhizobium]|uniref:hypothetical protein n=1 Tax=unclassified Bradyrhizobium TaxID=2631580 RepID=UPI003392EF07
MSPIMTIPDDYLQHASGLIVPKHFEGASDDDVRNEKLKVTGNWVFDLFDENGKLKDRREKKNLITTVGFQLISDALFVQSSRPAVASYIAVGTDATAAAIGNTALGAESARGLVSYSYATKVATLTYTFAAGTATAALTEAGVLNAVTVGTLLNRVTYSVINKGALDTLAATFTFTLS